VERKSTISPRENAEEIIGTAGRTAILRRKKTDSYCGLESGFRAGKGERPKEAEKVTRRIKETRSWEWKGKKLNTKKKIGKQERMTIYQHERRIPTTRTLYRQPQMKRTAIIRRGKVNEKDREITLSHYAKRSIRRRGKEGGRKPTIKINNGIFIKHLDWGLTGECMQLEKKRKV